jgi:hypothetical protein
MSISFSLALFLIGNAVLYEQHFVWKQHYPQMTDNVEFIVLDVFL